MDKIIIENLKIFCRLGVKPEERKHLRNVFVSVTLEFDMSKACSSDCLEDTVNYSTVAKDIQHIAYSGNFMLMEKMAEEIAAFCLKKYSISAITIRIRKPDVPANAEYAAVEIRRENKGEHVVG